VTERETQPDDPDDKDRLCEEALARSVCYGILARALHAPTEELVRELQSEQTQDALLYAATVLGRFPPRNPITSEAATTEDPSVHLPTAAADWLRIFPSLSLERFLEIHGRAFGHTARGAVCPYETEYGAEALFQQPQEMGDLMGFYRAFGLTVKFGAHERCDHINNGGRWGFAGVLRTPANPRLLPIILVAHPVHQNHQNAGGSGRQTRQGSIPDPGAPAVQDSSSLQERQPGRRYSISILG